MRWRLVRALPVRQAARRRRVGARALAILGCPGRGDRGREVRRRAVAVGAAETRGACLVDGVGPARERCDRCARAGSPSSSASTGLRPARPIRVLVGARGNGSTPTRWVAPQRRARSLGRSRASGAARGRRVDRAAARPGARGRRRRRHYDGWHDRGVLSGARGRRRRAGYRGVSWEDAQPGSTRWSSRFVTTRLAPGWLMAPMNRWTSGRFMASAKASASASCSNVAR